jgi:hypothetical protein
VTRAAGPGESEREIKHAIRVTLGRYPDVVLWENVVGVAQLTSGHTRRVGLCRGSADLIGVGPGGRFLAIEVKALRGRVSADQATFLRLVSALGGLAVVARSPADAVAAVNVARLTDPARRIDPIGL